MPETRYELRIYNPAGTLQYILTDYVQLDYNKAVNAPGLLIFGVNDAHPIVGNMARDWQVEVWRERAADSGETNGIASYIDFGGLIRDELRATDGSGQTTCTYYVVGYLHWLARSIVAYPAEVTNRTKFVAAKAETIAKTLVTRNATASGTTGDGRDRAVPTWGGYISVEADSARGNSLDVFCARRPLLEVLQEIARIAGGDFDLVKTGALAWQFRWYAGQRGTDRSASVVFALQYGNMSNPQLRRHWIEEATVAIVAGQGTEGGRNVVIRTGTNYDAAVNSIEVLVDARDVSTTDGLTARGNARLDELRAADDLNFSVIQTPGSLYGLHYVLGDLVTGYFQGITARKKIVGVTVGLAEDGKETIQLELQNA